MKQLFYDLETTGLDSIKCAIHQISGMVVVNGKVTEEFNLHLRPHEGAEVSAEALAVANLTIETIYEYPPSYEGYRKFKEIMFRYINPYDKSDKMFLCGYNNVAFDNSFLRQLFLLNNDQYFGSFFWSNSIDVMVLASQKLCGIRHLMPNFKQGTVAKALGIQIDDSSLHDALYDVRVCKKIYDCCCQHL